MASIKFGSIVTDIKGKIGGTTFQGGKAAPIMKNNPVISATQLLNCITVLPGMYGSHAMCYTRNGGLYTYRVAHFMKQLSTDQVNAWMAACPLFPYTDKMGNVVTPTWNNLYYKFTSLLLQMGITPAVLPPSPPTFPLLDTLAFTCANATLDNPRIIAATNGSAYDPLFKLQVYASVSKSVGATMPRGGFKNLGLFNMVNGQKSYTFTLTHIPVVADSLEVLANGETFEDNPFGVLTGNHGSTGTIDYVTGIFTLDFIEPPAVDATVAATYNSGEIHYEDDFTVASQVIYFADLAAAYLRKFGQILTGQGINFKFRWVQVATGVPSASTQVGVPVS